MSIALLLCSSTLGACGGDDKSGFATRDPAAHRSAKREQLPDRTQSLVYAYVIVYPYFDIGRNVWIYDYTVGNASESQSVLDQFALQPVRGVVDLSAPAHWGVFHAYHGDSLGVVWAVTDHYDYAPGGWDGVTLPPSPYALQPGQSLGGFLIESYHAPANNVEWFAVGYERLKADSVDVDEGDPFRQLEPTIWDAQEHGYTSGPSGAPPPTVGADSQAVIGGSDVVLRRPAPVPSRGIVSISCFLPKRERLAIRIYDTMGRPIRRLADAEFERGYRNWSWDSRDDRGRSVSPGIYYVVLEASGRRLARERIVIVR